jgi:predicted metal-binding protein
LRSLYNREGAFARYRGQEVELVGYTTCAGCPGGNIEYAPEEMKKNGATAIHLATGLIVGYPPCPYLPHFKSFLEEKYGLAVVIGTHPIPENYFRTHTELGTWKSPEWQALLNEVLCDGPTRTAYD